jgi:hypothetical protein
VSFEYLDLADYLAIAEEVTGLDVRTLVRVAMRRLTIDLTKDYQRIP